MEFTLEELKAIHSGLVTLEEDYGDHDNVELREKVEAEIERLEIEEGA